MKLDLDSITTLAGEGRKTLQVPDTVICFTAEEEAEWAASVVEHPDEWFIYLRNNIPSVGKQGGFLYLTRLGYEANKERLKAAFTASDSCTQYGSQWSEFEAHAEDHFNKVEKALYNAQAKLRKQLTELEKIVL